MPAQPPSQSNNNAKSAPPSKSTMPLPKMVDPSAKTTSGKRAAPDDATPPKRKRRRGRNYKQDMKKAQRFSTKVAGLYAEGKWHDTNATWAALHAAGVFFLAGSAGVKTPQMIFAISPDDGILNANDGIKLTHRAHLTPPSVRNASIDNAERSTSTDDAMSDQASETCS